MPKEEEKKEKGIQDEFDIYNLLTGIHNKKGMLSRNIPLATLNEKAQTYVTEQTVLVKLMYDFIARISKKQADKLVETFMIHIESIALVQRNQKTNVTLIGFLNKGQEKRIEQEIKDTKTGVIKKIGKLFGKNKKEENE